MKRYKLFKDSMADCFCDIDEHEKGSFVDYDEAATLEKKLAEAEKQLIEETKALHTLATALRNEGLHSIVDEVEAELGIPLTDSAE